MIGADDIDPEDLASGFHVEGPDPDELADEAWLDDEWILDAGDDLPDVSMFDPGEDPFPAELLDDSEHPYDPFPEEG